MHKVKIYSRVLDDEIIIEKGNLKEFIKEVDARTEMEGWEEENTNITFY